MSATIERRRASQYTPNAGQAGPTLNTRPGGGYAYAFSGYVLQWNSLSEDLGGYREVVRPNAFNRVLATSKNIVAILDHSKEVRNVLGSTAGGTLVLQEDERGLAFIVHAADTQSAQDAAKVIRDNPIGVSFAFIAGKQRRTVQADSSILREILEVEALEEISLVVDAAYKSSSVTVVAMADARSQRTPYPEDIGVPPRQRPTVDYLRRQLEQNEMEFACRSNPHHDEDGLFHDGSPESLLSAARGRLTKAQTRHARACTAYRAATEQYGPDHYDTLNARQSWMEARLAHQAAIEGADACIADATTQYRALIESHKQQWASPEYANPAAQASAAPVM